jgi:hypothetical protein
MKDTSSNPSITFPVFESADLNVISGANFGDAISFAVELNPGDIYELRPKARQHFLSLSEDESGSFEISYDTNLGHIGATVHLDSCLTLMTSNGITAEVLILVEVDHLGDVEAIFTVPLDPLVTGADYTLIDISRQALPAKFASVAIVNEIFMDIAAI